MAQEQIKSVQGTEDVLPGRWGHWRALYATARRLFERYGYGEIRTPIFEDTRLFVKGTGETTEIVEKQMYSIPRAGTTTTPGAEVAVEGITLRPEGTPPVIRSYLEHNLHKQRSFQKLYYIGPMFRRERPQRGRLRQFHQLGVEAIGSDSPLLDAETIILAADILREVGLSGSKTFINSMGCAECRPAMRRRLHAALAQRLGELGEDDRERLQRNVFRVLDSKDERSQAIVADLPPITADLCPACAAHYDQVKAALATAGLEFEEDGHLVRGLDYYTRTVYEIKHESLGARDTLCGGGRYDDLVKLLGGPPMPCVGFAMGAEATILAMEGELGAAPESSMRPGVYVVCFAEEARRACFELVQELRRAGMSADMDFEGRSPKAQMRAANRLGAPICLLMGPDELNANKVTIKAMAAKKQWSVDRSELVRELEAQSLGLRGEGT